MEMENKDKRTDVCKLHYAILAETIIEDYPGDSIRVSLFSWNELKFAEASLKETEGVNGEMIEEEVSIKITGSNTELSSFAKTIVGTPILLRFDFSGGEKKVLGSDENPVVLSSETSGSPIAHFLTCKRLSSEKSKNLIE